MASSAEEMSQGATEQVANAEEVSSSMEETDGNIRQNADNAHRTESISKKRLLKMRRKAESRYSRRYRRCATSRRKSTLSKRLHGTRIFLL